MDCLICGNTITIHQFNQILSLEEPKTCSECSSQMIEINDLSFPIRLYEDNSFMREFLQRLQQGDFILYEIMIKRLVRIVSKFECDIERILPFDHDFDFTYPPSEVLVERLLQHQFNFRGKQTLFVTYELSLESKRDNQMIISIL